MLPFFNKKVFDDIDGFICRQCTDKFTNIFTPEINDEQPSTTSRGGLK
ncbi:hypothetical protein M153_6870001570 [Pseudoloma neurophilia]|uniref:Uncharacterized protein n=1 Tax=Pseudoloma neurophilia TaxID=146866 RepID=A0A0R0LWB7_9MICR|nr:hypothetical protein M153_6870001570 [Pseudoloma neurophilia]